MEKRHRKIAKDMMPSAPESLLNFLDMVNDLVVQSGGSLRSRQIIALACAIYAYLTPTKGAE
jgi:hypothetical protein